jgi:hypothetical protein
MPGFDPNEWFPFDPEDELDGCLDAIEFAPEPPPEDADIAWPEARPEEQ